MSVHEVEVVRDSTGQARWAVWRPRQRAERRGRWYVRVRSVDTGRVHKLATRARSRTGAAQEARDWCAAQVRKAEGIQAEPQKDSFDEAFKRWLGLKSLRPSTRRDLEAARDGVLLPAFGKFLVHEIGALQVEEFLRNLETERKLAPKTRHKYLQLLRSFFKWALKHDMTLRDPTADLKVPRGAKRHGYALTVDEARALVTACGAESKRTVRVRKGKKSKRRRPGTWDQTWAAPKYLQLAVLIALHSGLRRGNIVGLRWRHVDLTRRTIRLSAEETKSHADYLIPLHPELCEELDRLLAGRRRVPEELVLGEELGSFTRAFRSALERAGLPPIRLHDLRHTVATWWGVRAPHAVWRALLGHSPGSMSEKYFHPPLEALREVVDAGQRLLTPEAIAARKDRERRKKA